MSTPVCDVMVAEVVVIDRIVEEVAVIEWSPDCLMDVPTSWLPHDVREGDRLRLQFRRVPVGRPLFLGGDRPPPARRLAVQALPAQPRSTRNEDNANG